MKKRIFLSPPHMGGSEQKFIQEAFDSNYIAPLGQNVVEFEKSLCNYTGTKECVVLSSGTAAIHLALIILGVKSGNEVLCSSFTFCASANPIVYQGAKPIFVDSEKETWNMCPEMLEKAIEDRIAKTGRTPKALVLVHLYGMPAQMDKIMTIAERYQIPVIEDAAEALGSTYKGQHLGSFGDFGVYSFNGNKMITTSGGGALVCENKKWADRARFLSTQARDEAPYYQHTAIGYNYRMSNVLAGIGRGQMEVLDAHVTACRSNFSFYKELFKNVKGISFLNEPDEDYFSNFWLTTALIDKERSGFGAYDLMAALDAENIESRPLWKPMHLQPFFASSSAYINGVSEQMFDTGICFPSPKDLNSAQKQRMTACVVAFLNSL
jgi:dTDP-4-amino-4,6-dideoxygalactose transaminase